MFVSVRSSFVVNVWFPDSLYMTCLLFGETSTVSPKISPSIFSMLFVSVLILYAYPSAYADGFVAMMTVLLFDHPAFHSVNGDSNI